MTDHEKIEPSVFNYLNYRAYIKDLYSYKKASGQDQLTYRKIAKEIGLKSQDYLTMILDGRRNLVPSSTMRLANFLRLKSRERDYLLALVEWNQAKTTAEKELHWENVLQFAPTKTHVLNNEEVKIFQHWFILALYELLTLDDFKEDPSWISHKFRRLISTKEAKVGLEILEQCQLVKRLDGKLVRAKGNTLSGGTPSELLRIFHSKMLDVAKVSIFAVPFEERIITNTTLAIPAVRYGEFRELVEQFQKDVMQLASKQTKEIGPIDSLYQLSVALYPLTERKVQL